jgi:hypothetical protein
MNKSPKLLLVISTLIMAMNIQAEQAGFITPEQAASLFKKQTATEDTNNTVTKTTFGYLGIGFDKIPAAIRAHLPTNTDKQQGLIVTRFADNSPAADDGMKVYDVLLNYDAKPIKKPEDFIQTIRNDKPGRIVKFTLLRQGQILTLPVTIGSQQKKKTIIKRTLPQAQYPIPAQIQRQAGKAPPPDANFNGLAIRKIGKDIYDASIGFIGQNGKPARRSYKGNRMQILQQIIQAKDLPPQTRQQLLFAVQPRRKQNSGWAGMPKMPFGNNNGFNPNRFFKGWGW